MWILLCWGLISALSFPKQAQCFKMYIKIYNSILKGVILEKDDVSHYYFFRQPGYSWTTNAGVVL